MLLKFRGKKEWIKKKKDPDSSPWPISYTLTAKYSQSTAMGAVATQEADTLGGGTWEDWKVSAETENKECQFKGCIVKVQVVFLSIFHNEAFLLLPPVLITDQCSPLSVTKLLWFFTYLYWFWVGCYSNSLTCKRIQL